jgi:hypothetical protein
MAVTCYLDESGTDLQNAQAVLAGLIMREDQFFMLDALWESMLLRHKIDPPLHMKEFGPHGRHGHLKYDERYGLFIDVANYINAHIIVSVAATLKHDQYINIINDKMKKHIGIYGICFMLCAHICFSEAWTCYYAGDLYFAIEAGNEHAEHVRRAHDNMIEMKKENKIWVHSGSLTFESKKLSALQAADVIAWGINRRDNQRIGKGFQPTAKIFNYMHIQLPWTDELLKDWNDSVMQDRDIHL